MTKVDNPRLLTTTKQLRLLKLWMCVAQRVFSKSLAGVLLAWKRKQWLTRMGEPLQTFVSKKVRSKCAHNIWVFDALYDRQRWVCWLWNEASGVGILQPGHLSMYKVKIKTVVNLIISNLFESDARRATEAWGRTSARSNTSSWTSGRTARWPGWKRWDWIKSPWGAEFGDKGLFWVLIWAHRISK